MKAKFNILAAITFLLIGSASGFSTINTPRTDNSASIPFDVKPGNLNNSPTVQGTPSQEDPECIKQRSLYREDYLQRNFELALKPWRYMIENCPDFTENLYIQGAVMLRYFIDKETDPVKREELVDFLLSLFDQRIKYYGNEGVNLSRKAVELRNFRPKQYLEQYELTERSIEIDKISANLNAVIMNLESVIRLYNDAQTQEQKEMFNETIIFEKFDRAMQILQENLKNLPDNIDDIVATRTIVENMYLPFASCEKVIRIYEPRFEDNPLDEDILKQTSAFLERLDCADSELFFKVAKNLHQLNPSARSANSMGRMEENNENYLSAIEYYEQALKLDSNDNGIVRYSVLMRLANLYNNMNRYSEARTHAIHAAEERPNCGRPWLLIASMYAASVNDCAADDEVLTYAVYWAATDKAIRARNVDENTNVRSLANNMIAAYTARFPDQERLFLLGLDGGQSVRTGCWIGETTVARAR